MRVPRYEPLKINTTPVAVVEAKNTDSGLSGAIDQVNRFNKKADSIVSMADAWSKETIAQQQKEEVTAINKAKLEAMSGFSSVLDGEEKSDGTFAPGLTSAQGDQAEGLEGKYKQKHDEIITKAKEQLKNFPDAVEKFDLWAGEKYINHAEQLNKIQMKERHLGAMASSAVMEKTAYDEMLRTYVSGGEVDIFKPDSDLATAVQQTGKLQGWKQDQIDRKLSEVRSNLISDMIESSLKEKTSQGLKDARALYDNFKEDIGAHNQKIVNELNEKITTENNWQVGEGKARTVFDTYKPSNINEPVNLPAMRDAIRNDASLEHEQKKIAEAKVEEYGREYEQQKKAHEEGTSNRIIGLRQQGSGYSALRREVADSGVDSKAKENLYDWLDKEFKISEGKAEEKKLKSLAQLSNLLTFQQDYLSGKYGKLSSAQVATKYIPYFGSFTDNAMQFVENANKDLGKAQLTESELKENIRILRQNKEYSSLLPDPDGKKDTDKADMALLHGYVQSLKSSSQDAPGKGMSTQDAILKSITKINAEDGWFGYKQKPIFKLGAQDEDPRKWTEQAQVEFVKSEYQRKFHKPLTDGNLLQTLRKQLVSGGK